MKLTPQKREEISSATITQALGLILLCSALFVLTTYASPPSWWSSRSAVLAPVVTTNAGVVTTNYLSNDYAVVVQGQLKLFTARAVDELNAKLSGGAGTNLNSMVSNWALDYATNNYSATNIKPSDFDVVNVGQVKYIGNKIWNQLFVAGYTNAVPMWLAVNTNSDSQVANLGQLKTIFNFDLSSLPVITSPATASGTLGVSFSYTITASGSPISYSMTGSIPGLSFSAGVISGIPTAVGVYAVRIGATNAHGTSLSTLTVTINATPPVITSGTTASGTVGTPFTYQITASNVPTGFSASGLPSWLTINTSTGLLSGTPTSASSWTISLGATNAGGSAIAVSLTVTTTNPPAPVITSGTTATGDVGVAFSYTIMATHSPTAFSASGLPTGLTLNTATGLISGTPASTGTSTVMLGASNAGGSATSVSLSLTVADANAPIITSGLAAAALHGQAFNYAITATNSPMSFSASGLPAGLSINTGTGIISGMPTSTTASTVSVTISAINSHGTGSATLIISVNPPAPVITSSTTASGYVGMALRYTITASNSPTSFSASGLPDGLNCESNTGVISGTPTVAGSSTVTLNATNAGGTATASLSLSIVIPPPIPVIDSPTVASGVVGTIFSYTITTETTGTVSSYGASGLPSGLSINSSTGVISGTPGTTGTFPVTLSAGNVGGTGKEVISLIISPAGAPIITSATTTAGTVGLSFNYHITAANSPTSFSASGLPLGLSVNSTTGVISGTPVTVGTATVTIEADNIDGAGQSSLILTINPPHPVITSATTLSGTFGTPIGYYAITATNSPTDFGATGLPPGLIVDPDSGQILGTPTQSGTFLTTISASNAGGTGTATLTNTIAGTGSSPIPSESIADGDLHSLILKTDGTVWAEGSDGDGQLGDGILSDTSSYTPVSAVSGFTNIVAVAGGGAMSYALKSDGSVWAWGINAYGQLGNGMNGGGTSSADSDVPVPVSTSTGLANVKAIGGGTAFGLALSGTDGSVWTWGSDADGELGHNTFNIDTDTPLEVQIDGGYLTGVTAIAGGSSNGLALRNDGTVWEWGYDGNDELGDGSFTDSSVAVQVSGLNGITAVSAGYNFCAALENDGTVWTWGYNGDGELGNGTDVLNTAFPTYTGPVQVSNLAGVVAISCAGDHVLALKSDGTVYAWGGNSTSFVFGNGTFDGQSNIPVQVPGLSGIVAVAAGRFQNTVLASDGTVWGWGNDLLFSPVPIVMGNRSSILPPSITPAGGSFTSDQSVSIASSVAGTIHYTLDGTEPIFSSPGGSGPLTFTLSASALVSAAVFNSSGDMVTPIASSQFYVADTDETGFPVAATGLSVTAGSAGDLQLSWTLSGTANYSEIGIYRSTNGGDYELIGVIDPGTSTFDDTNVQAANSYQYKIGTFNDSGETDTSATSGTSPTSATGLIINVTTPSGATPQ